MNWPADGDWARFFAAAPTEDAAWALHLLLGGRVKRVDAAVLRAALVEALDLPEAVVDLSVAAVKEPGVAAALMFDTLRTAPIERVAISTWMETRLLGLARLPPAEQIEHIGAWFGAADLGTSTVMARLMLGGTVRIGFEQVRDALAEALDRPAAVITHRLLAPFEPTPAAWARLAAPASGAPPSARLPALPQVEVDQPPPIALPLVWRLPGPLVQLVKRAGEVHLWADDARPRTAMFPEIAERAADLPDGTVLDGVLRPRMAARDRLGRRRLSPRMRATPVDLVVTRVRHGSAGLFDVATCPARDPATLRAEARAHGATGVCWIGPDADLVWPAPTREVIAALVYLQVGRRYVASFAVEHGGEWLPVAKVEVDQALYQWVKANTVERSGPVRVVPPTRRFRLVGGLTAAPRRKAKLWLEGAEIVGETDAPAHSLSVLEGWLHE